MRSSSRATALIDSRLWAPESYAGRYKVALVVDKEREIHTALLTTIPQDMGVDAIDPDEFEAGLSSVREENARAREEFVAELRGWPKGLL